MLKENADKLPDLIGLNQTAVTAELLVYNQFKIKN